MHEANLRNFGWKEEKIFEKRGEVEEQEDKLTTKNTELLIQRNLEEEKQKGLPLRHRDELTAKHTELLAQRNAEESKDSNESVLP